MKKAINYLYREILLEVNVQLDEYYSDEYEENEYAKNAIDTFKQQMQLLRIEDVEEFNEELIEEIFKETNYETWIGDMDIVREVINEFRESGEKIDDKVEQGRYCCYQDVARKITGKNDLFLGWTYYFGGGKHSQPETIEWMEDCYLLTCREEARVIKVYEEVKE